MPDFESQKRENEELILEDELEGRAIPQGLPPWLGMHTTTACNLKCIFCLQADGLAPVVRMAEDVFSKFGEELFPTARVVQLTASGEPLMTPELPRVLDALAHFGVKLEVITNATLLKDRSIIRIAAELADTFTFSIDGATAETFNALRVGANFDRVFENIRFWNQLRLKRPRSERPRMVFHYILMKPTIREVSAMVDIAHAMRADILSTYHLSEHREEVKGFSLQYHRAESNYYLERARERAKELGVHFATPAPYDLSPEENDTLHRTAWPAETSASTELLRSIRADEPAGAEPGGADLSRWQDPFPSLPGGLLRCHFLWRRTYVSPDGNILTCCHPDAESMGNIRSTSFREIWTGEQYTAYRRTVYGHKPKPICDNCFLIGRSGRTLSQARHE